MLALVLGSSFVAALTFSPTDPDTDRDGISDFRETHKHFTDPLRADSDGDGTPDGDWAERREFAYTVRSVLRVLRPCGGEDLTDDYQDVRVLANNDRYTELEVFH